MRLRMMMTCFERERSFLSADVWLHYAVDESDMC